MAQATSNLVKNGIAWTDKPATAQPTFNLPSGSGQTVQSINIPKASPTMGMSSPSGLLAQPAQATAPVAPVAPMAAQTAPKAAPVAPLVSSGLVSNGGIGTASSLYNPNATTGQAGSLDPTLLNQGSPQPGTGGTAMTGIPAMSGASYTAANQGTPAPTFPGLVSDLLAKTQGIYSQQTGLSQQAQDTLKQINEQEAALTGGSYSGMAADYSGRLAQLENLKQNVIQATSAQQQALAAQEAPLTSAYSTAINASQPQIAAYGQTTFNPITGQFGGGTGGGGTGTNLDVQGTAQGLAQQVINGKMTYADAVNSLGYAGAAGQQFLNSAISQINPAFNFSQAQALGTTQGQVAPQLQMAQQALNNLQNVFKSVPGWQATGIPALNSLSNLFSGTTGIGLGSETEKQNAINEARTQVANALGVMTNTTPTAWTSTVQSWFPTNATPAQVQAGVEQFSTLAQNRQQIYGTPGSVQPYSANQNASSNIFSW